MTLPLIQLLLEPPKECQATCLPMKDKRKASIWVCKLSRKIIGASKGHPGCKCAKALMVKP